MGASGSSVLSSTHGDPTDTMQGFDSSSSVVFSLDNDMYRQLLTSHVVEEFPTPFEFRQCRVCWARRNISINPKTQYFVDFQLHDLDVRDHEFLPELITQCRAANVVGYIVYTSDREDASGVLEGSIRSINKVKKWLMSPASGILEPHHENIYFSWFLITRQPSLVPFAERLKESSGDWLSEIGLSD